MERESFDVYWAAPLFSDAEREFNRIGIESLQHLGYKVVNPYNLAVPFIGSDDWQKKVFEANIEHIDNCRMVVAVLDGAICDDGTSFECGYAYANGIPIVGYRTDFRSVGPEGEVNLMLGESVKCIACNEKDLVDAVFRIIGAPGE